MDDRGNILHYRDMKQVPTYFLYGENDAQGMRDWLHWETIQARSRLHGYHIAPHRHDGLFQLLIVAGGEVEVLLDETRMVVVPPAVILVPGATIHGFRFSEDVEGRVVTLRERDLQGLGLELGEAVVLQSGLHAVTGALEGLLEEAARPAAGHDLAMQAHLALLAVGLRRALVGTGSGRTVAQSALNHLQAFRQLIDERFRTTRRLSDYAGALGISTAHLNRLTRQVAGSSALGLIERRIALEGRRMLLFSNLTIKEIGAELGYEDPAYFTRFMTRMLGQPPGLFRAGGHDAIERDNTAAS